MAVQLLHPETREGAAALAQQCSFIIYTSFCLGGGETPWPSTLKFEKPWILSPRPRDTCFVVFSDTPPEHGRPPLGWHFIHHRRTDGTMHFSARAFSKLPKLMPTLLFGQLPTLFKDTKITLNARAPAKILSLLNEGSNFVAWAHPCQKFATAFSKDAFLSHPIPCNAKEWIINEAKAVADAGRTGDAAKLLTSAHEYAETLTPDDLYIDTAVLAQRDAWPLFTMWENEMFGRATRGPPQDRDQLTFAHVFALMEYRPESVYIVPFGRQPCESVGLCHWWVDDSLGSLHRIDWQG